MLTIEEDLGLDNGDEAGVLCNGSVAGEAIGGVTLGDHGRTGGDGDDSPPLGEPVGRKSVG